MKPVSSNIDKYRKGGCMPISASCVTWDGPDISCINLCKGDTIDVVIYELAKILCDITENVLDVTTLDFECLVENGQCPPETLLETLQLLITNACTTPTPPDPPGPTPLPNVDLPECLWYVDGEGDTVTALPLDEYVEYLASQICQILTDIGSINAVITSLNTRVTILEAAIGGGGGSTPVTNITTKCLSGSAPGQILPITTAFSNLEQKLCEYLALLGSLTEWQTMFDNICIDSTTALPCGTGTYGSIPGWINDPQTVAGSINNLWLVVCKINDCISASPALPCVVVPPVSASLSNLTTTSCRVNWVAPSTPSSQAPIGYKIEVFNISGAVPPLISVIVADTPLYYNIVDPAIVAGTRYVVRVAAIFDCGNSSTVETTGILKEVPYVAKLFYVKTVQSNIAKICTNPVTGVSTPYTERTDKITISLKDGSGNPVINSGSQIDTIINLKRGGCGADPDTYFDVIISIPTGFSTGFATFIASQSVFCAGGGGCQLQTTTVYCWDGSTYTGGAPLPTTIGIDTSLSGLGTC
jgi:hypothetical protein